MNSKYKVEKFIIWKMFPIWKSSWNWKKIHKFKKVSELENFMNFRNILKFLLFFQILKLLVSMKNCSLIVEKIPNLKRFISFTKCSRIWNFFEFATSTWIFQKNVHRFEFFLQNLEKAHQIMKKYTNLIRNECNKNFFNVRKKSHNWKSLQFLKNFWNLKIIEFEEG